VAKENVVRFGLNAIKGVGEAAVEDIIAERESNGPYLTVYDFIKRVNQRTVNKKSLESLVLAGGLDCFSAQLHRAQYFYAPPHPPLSQGWSGLCVLEISSRPVHQWLSIACLVMPLCLK
jgi:DNA polymerase-3 subunit alpha